MKRNGLFIFWIIITAKPVGAQADFIQADFTKLDTLIPMRDGVKLYTIIYTPKDDQNSYPILLNRTPYSAGPYGKGQFPNNLGPNPALSKAGYIFVNQDVRGRYMSEGHNLEVTPHRPLKKNSQTVDESSDAYDTIEFLLKLLKNHNGRVGIYGISYPGFYASAALPQAHPAIKAASPQAPVTDEFIGDDVNHHGAFFLLDNFNFINYFGFPRQVPLPDYPGSLTDTVYQDAYKFFLELGPVSNTQDPSLFNHKSYIWDEYLANDTYNDYWKSRNIRPHLKNIAIPTLVVGGWFDAEDCFGALRTYEAIELQNKPNQNYLVMGPWTHGAWAGKQWNNFGPYRFGSNTSQYFQDSIETVFFNFYLKDLGNFNLREALMFETGSNLWKTYAAWPPAHAVPFTLNLMPKNKLDIKSPKKARAYTEYWSDPAQPVPYTSVKQRERNNRYMVEDQRFTSGRSDVVSWQTNILNEDMTFTGPIEAAIYASTSGTDMDLIVKVIDVWPDSTANTGGAQFLIRAEVFRGKFRNSYTVPQSFTPGKAELIKFTLPDINHRFLKGHRLMVQIQSSWFPLVDRNPQQFLSIPKAQVKDFRPAAIRIYCDKKKAISFEIRVGPLKTYFGIIPLSFLLNFQTPIFTLIYRRHSGFEPFRSGQTF